MEAESRLGYFAAHLAPEKIHDLSDLRVLSVTHRSKRALSQIPKKRVTKLKTEPLKLLEKSYTLSKIKDRFDQTNQALHKVLVLECVNNQFFNKMKTIGLMHATRHLTERNRRTSKQLGGHS